MCAAHSSNVHQSFRISGHTLFTSGLATYHLNPSRMTNSEGQSHSMDRFSSRITRRSFLSLPAMVPLATVRWARSDEHHFPYDHVIGTSLDLVVWTSSCVAAQRAEAAVLEEVHQLTSILNTRDPGS